MLKTYKVDASRTQSAVLYVEAKSDDDAESKAAKWLETCSPPIDWETNDEEIDNIECEDDEEEDESDSEED